MPKIKASMKEVSTEFTPVEPGIYRFEIESVTEHTDDGPPERTQYHVKCKILEVLAEGNEDEVGRSMTEKIHIHKVNGDLNEFGLGQLKRYFEVTVGEEMANDEEPNTDWIIGQQFRGQVIYDPYEVTNKITGEKETRNKSTINQLVSL